MIHPILLQQKKYFYRCCIWYIQLFHYPFKHFFYWRASDPLSPSHDQSAECATTKENTKPGNNPRNPLQNVPIDPDSEPSSLDSSSSNLYDLSDNEYHKQIQQLKKGKNRHQSKTRFDEPIKNAQSLHTRYLQTRENKR